MYLPKKWYQKTLLVFQQTCDERERERFIETNNVFFLCFFNYLHQWWKKKKKNATRILNTHYQHRQKYLWNTQILTYSHADTHSPPPPQTRTQTNHTHTHFQIYLTKRKVNQKVTQKHKNKEKLYLLINFKKNKNNKSPKLDYYYTIWLLHNIHWLYITWLLLYMKIKGQL